MKSLLPLLAMLACAAAASARPGSTHLIADPAAPQRVDYLVVCGDAFAGGLDVLAGHRAGQGLAVGIVKMSAVTAKFKSIRPFLAHAVARWTKPAPRHLLLVGDVDTVPTVVKKGRLRGWGGSKDLATDFDYARPLDGRVRLHVGRFPCDTPAELAVMVRKTLDYETRLAPGGWQHRLKFVASVGGYSKEIDTLLESIGMQIAATGVPADFDVQAAYGSPNSPFCPYPPRFNRHVLEMFNEGSLLALFVGHGSRTSVARLVWRGRGYRIFGARDAAALKVRQGLPILTVIACHTGRFDAADCLGETYLKTPAGPVAFIGGSRVTQPYGNGLFARAFILGFFSKARTLGEALTSAKQHVLAHPFSLFRLQVDTACAGIQGKDALGPMRADVVEHYNLLGDPALVIRRPKRDITVTLDRTTLRILAPGREAVDLTLECARLDFLHPLPAIAPDDPDFEKKISDRYQKAHDKVIRRWAVKLKDGKGAVTFEPPKRPGTYFFKASAGGSVGSAKLTVPPVK